MKDLVSLIVFLISNNRFIVNDHNNITSYINSIRVVNVMRYNRY